jgi:hypothetical protein
MESEIGYYKISKAELTQGNFAKGNNITISRVGAYDENGKWIKWISLQVFIDILNNAEIKNK